MISEQVHWHDRRTQKIKNGEPDEDGDEKQVRRPSGNSVIELFHPRSASHDVPGELYQGNAGLLLNKMAGNSPVWRLAFSRTQPRNLSHGQITLPMNDHRRIAYFAVSRTGTVQDEWQGGSTSVRRFFAKRNPRVVGPNQYVVIGTDDKMYLGVRNIENDDPTQDTKENNYPREIDLRTTTVDFSNQGARQGTALANIKQIVGVEMAPDIPRADRRKRRGSPGRK